MGDVRIAKRRIGRRKIERMAVRHDKHEATGRCVLQFRNRMKSLYERDIARHGTGKGRWPRIDPKRLKRQGRQGQDQCPTDMAGAEKK